MAFSPREFNQILSDMISYVRVNTTVTDFSIGAVVRSTLEAAALEDDEQYFQMVQLLDAFSVLTAKGSDLDRRVKDFNIFREPAKSAFGKVVFFDKNLTSDSVSLDSPSGSTTIALFSSENFPLPSPSYVIRVGEGTARVQDLTVTGHTPSGNLLTLSVPTTEDFFIGDRVSLIGAAGRTINAGESVQAPPTSSQFAKTYITQEAAFIEPGNFSSSKVAITSVDVGVTGNVSASRIKTFIATPPFSGAGVTNPAAVEGGTDEENDAALKLRALQKIQSLSRGTKLALKAESIGIEDPATGQRVVSSNILEPLVGSDVQVFVDDGSGFTVDTVILPAATVAAPAPLLGAVSIVLDAANVALFPTSGHILIRVAPTGGTTELVEYASKVGNELFLSTPLAFAHGLDETVDFVDVITLSAETGQRRFKVPTFPVVLNSELIFLKPPAADWAPLSRDVDYVINRGTGEFELVSSLGAFLGTQIVSNHVFYTNLIARVQKVLEGDINDSNSFPGVKAAGIFLSVETPLRLEVTVVASISAEDGFSEGDLAPLVKDAMEAYINSRGIGEDIIRSKLIDVAFNVEGVRDVTISDPVSNVVALDSELPVSTNTVGVSLVSVL